MRPGGVQLLIAACSVTLIVAAADSARAAAPGTLLPADARVGGRSYRQWERAWVKWRLGLPVRAAPSQGTCIDRRQHAPVWLLDGDGAQPNRVTRRCQIPAGRRLMLGPWEICSTVSPLAKYRASTDRGLRRCARAAYKRSFRSFTLIVDGQRLDPSAHRTATGAFAFRMPVRRNMLAAPGRSRGRAAVVADPALLTALDPGRHTLRTIERYAGGFTRRVTYKLTVG